MTCFCGATDCKSCGPAQGYTVVKYRGRYRELESLIEEAEHDEKVREFLDARSAGDYEEDEE